MRTEALNLQKVTKALIEMSLKCSIWLHQINRFIKKIQHLGFLWCFFFTFIILNRVSRDSLKRNIYALSVDLRVVSWLILCSFSRATEQAVMTMMTYILCLFWHLHFCSQIHVFITVKIIECNLNVILYHYFQNKMDKI